VIELLPPQAGISETPATTPSKARLLVLLLPCFEQARSKVSSAPSDIIRAADGPLRLKGELTDPEVGAGCELECAVVEMVSVTAVGVVPLTLTDAEGAKVQVAAAGTPLVHANATVLLNPSTAEALRLYVAG